MPKLQFVVDPADLLSHEHERSLPVRVLPRRAFRPGLDQELHDLRGRAGRHGLVEGRPSRVVSGIGHRREPIRHALHDVEGRLVRAHDVEESPAVRVDVLQRAELGGFGAKEQVSEVSPLSVLGTTEGVGLAPRVVVVAALEGFVGHHRERRTYHCHDLYCLFLCTDCFRLYSLCVVVLCVSAQAQALMLECLRQCIQGIRDNRRCL
mmetsp:Transcript_18086/g.33688  ORF Transcript_18086/g.33688 Transcript_18086/m.33688 type:complete len:207 (-) Transcript_18086:10-630(-)